MSQPSVRLLMLSHYFEQHRGGIEIVAARLAQELALLGFTVSWLATGLSNSDAEGSTNKKITLAAWNISEELVRIPYPILFPSSWRRIFQEAKQAHIILVHDALYMTSVVAFIASRFHKKPFVIVQHIGLVPYKNKFLRAAMELGNRFVVLPILRRSEKVIFISQRTLRFFAKARFRLQPALIFNGVDTSVFFPATDQAEILKLRGELGLPANQPIALFVGRFVQKKGLHVLEQMARMRSDILFAFAGWGGLDPGTWGLSNVHVFTSLSGLALASLYRASDVFLLPSVGEGFPLVLQEALACGLPVICGLDTLDADLRAAAFLKGIDIDLQNPKQTAIALSEEATRCLSQSDKRIDRLKRFEFAKSNYSWAACAAGHAEILRSFASQSAT